MSKPIRAFILAAGFGTRMRPLTDNIPKPMVEIQGRSLIWHILDRLREAGVLEVVVNAHYLADILEEHLQIYQRKYPEILISVSREDDILDTGGGIVHALPYFKGEAFYVIAGDAFWQDAQVPVLSQMAKAWDAKKMDVLSWMQAVDAMSLTRGVGDYDIVDDGRVRRHIEKGGTHMWTNIRINRADIYASDMEGRFSVLPIMDACEKAGRYYAIESKSQWHHISTPDDLDAVNKAIGPQLEKDDKGAA